MGRTAARRVARTPHRRTRAHPLRRGRLAASFGARNPSCCPTRRIRARLLPPGSAICYAGSNNIAKTSEDAMTDHSRRAVIAGASAGLATTFAAGASQAQGTVQGTVQGILDPEMLRKDVTSISIHAPLDS